MALAEAEPARAANGSADPTEAMSTLVYQTNSVAAHN